MVLICAVILTTVLFSSLFTISGSLINEMQRSTMRQVGGYAHSGFKYMTPEEYDKIKDDKEIKEIQLENRIKYTNEEFNIKKTGKRLFLYFLQFSTYPHHCG